MAELSSATRAFSARMEAIDRVAASADKAGASITTLADTATTESLPRINMLVDELARTSRNVDRLLADLREQPQSLIFGRKAGAPGPGEPGFEARSSRSVPERPSERSSAARVSSDGR